MRNSFRPHTRLAPFKTGRPLLESRPASSATDTERDGWQPGKWCALEGLFDSLKPKQEDYKALAKPLPTHYDFEEPSEL